VDVRQHPPVKDKSIFSPSGFSLFGSSYFEVWWIPSSPSSFMPLWVGKQLVVSTNKSRLPWINFHEKQICCGRGHRVKARTTDALNQWAFSSWLQQLLNKRDVTFFSIYLLEMYSILFFLIGSLFHMDINSLYFWSLLTVLYGVMHYK